MEINRNIAVQAELMGPGIQRNRENFDKHKFFIFDIWDIDQQRHLTPLERFGLVRQLFAWLTPDEEDCWAHVPVIEYVTIDDSWTLQKFLDYANRPSINHKIAEGVVFKSVKPNGISFKCISNQFLLKEKD
jgi:RNA ligase (TIGR02306 family)